MKTTLITGYLGFVGQHLTNLFDKMGLPWIGYDLNNNRQDIRNRHDLEYTFEKFQVRSVIHLAALTGIRRSKLYPDEYISTNILGTQNVVDMCNKFGIEKLVFYSSSSVFGNGDVSPFKEYSNKAPIALYGVTKLAGEHIVNNAECPTVVVRPFTIYGEGGRKDAVIYRWLEQYKNGLPITVYGDGDSCRGYVYVQDLVKATVEVLTTEFSNRHEDFNLGGSEVVYLRDIVKVFKEELLDAKFIKIDMPIEDVYINYSDISKAKEMIGFDPRPNFEDNLREIIKEFKKQNG